MELLFVQRSAVHAEESVALHACILSFNHMQSAVCVVRRVYYMQF